MKKGYRILVKQEIQWETFIAADSSQEAQEAAIDLVENDVYGDGQGEAAGLAYIASVARATADDAETFVFLNAKAEIEEEVEVEPSEQ